MSQDYPCAFLQVKIENNDDNIMIIEGEWKEDKWGVVVSSLPCFIAYYCLPSVQVDLACALPFINTLITPTCLVTL
jgi:hypothetical protein